jgi:hypothetical protein
MGFLSVAAGANYRRYFRKLKIRAKEEKRFYPFLLWDTAWCVFRYGMALTDYLNYKIYNRTAEERKRYAGVRHQNSFYETVNPSEYKKRFTVKPTFLKEFAAYTKRDFIVPAEDNYEAFLSYIQSRECFMSKPYDGIAGQDVKKVYSKDITDPKAYFEDCIANRIFLEDLVIQHPGMNVLCPASVNTLRIMTFNDHGKSRILWMGLRIGNGVHAVDNFHARGMVVGIDPETGRLIGNAVNTDNEEFSHHPTTGVQIDGFQIPCFEEAKELVLKAALESDKILVVGWDVAISENGPLIIEGNRRPGFVLPQVAEGRGRLDIMEDVLSCLKK